MKENYLIVDPCSGRNMFLSWFRVTEPASYLYREWPGNYYIPGQGTPGMWAEPDGQKADGRKGPAQVPFGWGLLEYKREIARLEKWKAYQDALKKHQDPLRIPLREVQDWDQYGEKEEEIERRYMDSRFASAPRLEKDRVTTILEDFYDIGLTFETTPGGRIDGEDGGIHMINNLLSYDEHREVDALNHPRLYIARSCINTRFALRTWTNEDGQRGACKDPIDNLHYFAALKLDPWAPEPAYEEDEEYFDEEPDTY